MAEELYGTLELMLCTVDETQLKAFCEYLGIDKASIEGVNKRKILREIREFIDESLDKSLEEQSVNNLTLWLQFLRRGLDDGDDRNVEVDDEMRTGTVELGDADVGPQELGPQELPPAVRQIEEMKARYESMLASQRREMDEILDAIQGSQQGHRGGKAKVNATGNSQNTLDSMVDPNNLNSMLRRELKIYGQIGEQGKGDQLSFVSLSRQIETAVEKGYTQKEVVEAVIKAMRPGLQLRSYVETLHDLTLPRLRQILRSHYKEKSGTQLYQELATIFQGPKESPDAFLLRALDLRQRVLFASKEADAILKYDPQLVQGMFLRSMETGLRDDNILIKFRSVLHTAKISDEELIQQMASISSAEEERQARIGKRAKDAQANSIVSGGTSEQKASVHQKKEAEHSPENRIFAAMQSMQAQIQSLQEELKSQRSETANQAISSDYNRPNYYERRQTRAPRNAKETPNICTACKEKGLSQSCTHCHYCGGENHFARDCLKRQREQGNGRGLRRGDIA